MKPVDLNLAGRPFLDRRAVDAIVALLFLAGGLLLYMNTAAWLRERSEGEAAERIADQISQIERLRAEIQTLRGGLEQAGTGISQDEIAALNRLIAQRTFSWVEMLSRLEKTLPEDVALSDIAPGVDADLRTVKLAIRGVALKADGPLRFMDRLFADPGFRHPVPRHIADQEKTGNPDGKDFALDVTYATVRTEAAP